jgi:hypothetical protein
MPRFNFSQLAIEERINYTYTSLFLWPEVAILEVPYPPPLSGSQIEVPYHPPNWGPKSGSQIRVPKSGYYIKKNDISKVWNFV